MGLGKTLWKLIKLYALFASANIIYKISQILLHVLRTKNLWAKLPGRHVDLTGKTFMLNARRLPDYILDVIYSSSDPTAPLYKFPYVEPAIVCNSTESIKWMLKDEFKHVTKPKESDPFFQLMTKFIGKDGIFVLRHGDKYKHDNDIWVKERKTASLIFTKTNMETIFTDTFKDKSDNLLDRLDIESNNIVDIQELFFSFTMDSIEKFFMGKDVNSVTGGMSTYAKNFDKAHYHMMTFVFNNMYIEVLNRVILPYPFGSLSAFGLTMNSWFTKTIGLFDENLKGFYQAINGLDKEIYHYIDMTLKDPKLPERTDIIANFLNRDKNISKERIRDVVLNLTLAGRDTTACTLSWLFFELTQNLEVQEKLFEEIKEKLNGKVPTLHDLSPTNMPYLNGVLYEALRMHPPVSIDTKKVSQDIYYKDGTLIPNGTTVVYSPYAVGRNPFVFKEPQKFDPTRWIPFSQPSLFELPVFQAGPRFCIGKDMAQFEAKFVTVRLVEKFRFEMNPEEAKKVSYSVLLTSNVVNNEDKSSSKLLVTPIKRKLN